jgi:hypothetical protein
MKIPPPTTKRPSPALRFRAEIEKAEAAGVARKDMTLRLTLGDASQLKRDPSVAVEDVSFADGAMRFLGVKTEQGGVAVSVLEHS